MENGVVTSVLIIDSERSVEVPPSTDRPRHLPIEAGKTAENLFEMIREHVGEAGSSAEFDADTGFPISFFTEGRADVIDDEYGFMTVLRRHS